MNANDLINTSSLPSGGYSAAWEGKQASFYYNLEPYPTYAFGPHQWDLSKGPIPTALPYGRTLVDEGAEFVFRGGSPTFSVPADQGADSFVSTVIKANRLSSRYISLATRAGIHGTIVAKFSYLPDSPGFPIRLSFLSVPEECRVWIDPHDQSSILMARIQYPYRSPENNQWYFFREEWTSDSWITYKPKYAADSSFASAASIPGYMNSFGDGEGWEIDQLRPNPFGLIPLVIIKNRAVEGASHGVGDCWNAFRLIDRIALTMHGEDRQNQLHSAPLPVAINADIDNEGPLLPGEPISVKNNDPDKAADFKLIEPSGAAREWSFRSIQKWEELLYRQVGLSLVDPATIGNKGNLTRLALMTAYARTIATSDRKRTLWGDSGLCELFSRMLIGLSRIGGFKELAKVDPDGDLDVSVDWPDYFAATDADICSLTDRTVTQIDAGLISTQRAAKRIATAEGIPSHELDDVLAEIEEERRIRQESTNAKSMPDDLVSDAQDSTAQVFSEAVDSSLANNFTA